ncbi:hypothetical protein ABEB36_004894 [Hypothenemus hampei]|uniref:Uncharacterized protein n=1 Tax=Hypothenemus hampei TaxID=57062 RepID=A0ABD1EWA9_HYPHA
MESGRSWAPPGCARPPGSVATSASVAVRDKHQPPEHHVVFQPLRHRHQRHPLSPEPKRLDLVPPLLKNSIAAATTTTTTAAPPTDDDDDAVSVKRKKKKKKKSAFAPTLYDFCPVVVIVLNGPKRGRHPPATGDTRVPAATVTPPPSLKRVKHEGVQEQDMEAPLSVALSQSMDSVNTNNGEEEFPWLTENNEFETQFTRVAQDLSRKRVQLWSVDFLALKLKNDFKVALLRITSTFLFNSDSNAGCRPN